MSERERELPRTQSEFLALTEGEQRDAVQREIRRIGEARDASEEDIQAVLAQGQSVLEFCWEGQQWEERELTINERFEELLEQR